MTSHLEEMTDRAFAALTPAERAVVDRRFADLAKAPARRSHAEPAPKPMTKNLTTARHLVDQAVFSIHALMQQSGPTPLMPALQSISGALQQALAELGEVEAGVGLAVHVLGGVR